MTQKFVYSVFECNLFANSQTILLSRWLRPKLISTMKFLSNWKIAWLKTWKPRKSRKSRKFFSEIFKSEFLILAVGQNWKVWNTKTRNNFFEVFKISDFCEFWFATFSFSFLFFLSVFISCFSDYVSNYSSTLYFIDAGRLSHSRNMISCVYVLIYKMHSQYIEYKMYLQNEKIAKLRVFVDFSNKRKFEKNVSNFFANETMGGITKRRSRPKVSFKIDVLEKFTKFTEKHLCWSLFF